MLHISVTTLYVHTLLILRPSLLPFLRISLSRRFPFSSCSILFTHSISYPLHFTFFRVLFFSCKLNVIWGRLAGSGRWDCCCLERCTCWKARWYPSNLAESIDGWMARTRLHLLRTWHFLSRGQQSACCKKYTRFTAITKSGPLRYLHLTKCM